MKVVQVSKDELREYAVTGLDKKNLFRVVMCDDGNYGKHHIAARLKPVKNLTIEEISAAFEDSNCAFIQIIQEDEN